MAPPRKGALSDESSMCPVCKSNTYLNPTLILKINPECYHKMCTSCIDRIFTSGPAPCPVAGCGKTLRKARFKVPRFGDLAIERECDIRARVAAVLNHSEADFESLRAFNDYLEDKEELVMALVNGAEKERRDAEAKLRAHERDNAASIAANRAAEENARDRVQRAEQDRKQRSELARAEALRERAEELAEREAGRREVVDKIMHANADVLRVAKEAERVVQKRAAARLHAGSATGTANIASGSGDSAAKALPITTTTGDDVPKLTFKGLKKFNAPKSAKAAAQDEGPYDPFAGLELRFRYYSLKDAYFHPWSTDADRDTRHAAAGFAAAEYQRRAQLEGHAGLGVFVGAEKG